jgi:hypothetical protein
LQSSIFIFIWLFKEPEFKGLAEGTKGTEYGLKGEAGSREGRSGEEERMGKESQLGAGKHLTRK